MALSCMDGHFLFVCFVSIGLLTGGFSLRVLQEEQIAQLQAFVSAQCDYHRQAMETLQTLLETLEIK